MKTLRYECVLPEDVRDELPYVHDEKKARASWKRSMLIVWTLILAPPLLWGAFNWIKGELGDRQIKAWASEAGFKEADFPYIFESGETYSRDSLFELKVQSEHNFNLSDEAAQRLVERKKWQLAHPTPTPFATPAATPVLLYQPPPTPRA
jgi:hypothetical protein